MKHLKNFVFAYTAVYKNIRYSIFAVGVAFALYAVSNVLPNFSFVKFALTSPSFSLATRLSFLLDTLRYIPNNTPLYGVVLTICTCLLSGITVGMAVFVVRRKIAIEHAAHTGFWGVLLGLLGVGCGACGSVLLSTLIGIGASAHVLGFLPLKGIEFSILSFGLLVASLLYISGKIAQPDVCLIRPSKR